MPGGAGIGRAFDRQRHPFAAEVRGCAKGAGQGVIHHASSPTAGCTRGARGAAGWSLCRCDGDEQLAVAHANVEFAADGEADLFQPAAA